MIVRYPVVRYNMSEYGRVAEVAIDLRDVRAVWHVMTQTKMPPSGAIMEGEGVQVILADAKEPSILLATDFDAFVLAWEQARKQS